MQTPTTTPRHPIDARAERILAAAWDEFARHGFAKAKESAIARRASVSSPTLRLYFPTKAELFREVIRSTIVNSLPVRGEASAPATAAGATTRVREAARRFLREMAQPGNGALLQLSVGELPRFPDLALFHATEVIGRAALDLEKALAEGVATGELKVADPRTTARVILSALITHAHWFAFPEIYVGIIGTDPFRAEEAVLDVLVNGLRAGCSTPRC